VFTPPVLIGAAAFLFLLEAVPPVFFLADCGVRAMNMAAEHNATRNNIFLGQKKIWPEIWCAHAAPDLEKGTCTYIFGF
jgi:hypothetical protein